MPMVVSSSNEEEEEEERRGRGEEGKEEGEEGSGRRKKEGGRLREGEGVRLRKGGEGGIWGGRGGRGREYSKNYASEIRLWLSPADVYYCSAPCTLLALHSAGALHMLGGPLTQPGRRQLIATV